MLTLEKNRTSPPDIRDHCDHAKCNAPALVRVVIVGGQDLVFCGHHFDHLPATSLGVMECFCDTRDVTS